MAWPEEDNGAATNADEGFPDLTETEEGDIERASSGEERDEIGALREELSELNGKWLRALADLDNYRKRIERERLRWAEGAREGLLLSLVEIVDDFERAIACGDVAPPSDEPFRAGVELILKRLVCGVINTFQQSTFMGVLTKDWLFWQV